MSTLELVNEGGGATGTETGNKRALDVHIAGSDIAFGGGSQYTEGDTDATISGSALMMEGAANTLLPVQGSVTDGLLVNLGSNNDVNVTQFGSQSINLGAGAVDTGTQRFTLASNDPSVALLTTINKASFAGSFSVDSFSTASISTSANAADQALVAAPGANKQIWVYGVNFTVGTGAGSVSFQDEDNVPITGVMPFAQLGGMAVSPTGNFAMPLWKLATNKALEVDTVTCDIKGSLQYAIVSV